jgi:hypothetical protein
LSPLQRVAFVTAAFDCNFYIPGALFSPSSAECLGQGD